MAETYIQLWNHESKQLNNVKINLAQYPYDFTHNNVTYFASGIIPGVYIAPASEEALIAVYSIILQNMDTLPAINEPNFVDWFNNSFSTTAEFPDQLEKYLYSDHPKLELSQSKVVVSTDIQYRKHFHQFLKMLINDHKLENKSILEVGAGNGVHLLYLKNLLPDAQIHGIEPAINGIEISKKAAEKWNLPIEFHQANGDTTPESLKGKQFDLVFCHAMLMHINPDKAAAVLRNMCSLSKKWVALFDVFPELWEPGTKRTLASLNNNLLKRYSFGNFRGIMSGQFQLPAKVIRAHRFEYSWNPLCEPSFVLLEVNQ